MRTIDRRLKSVLSRLHEITDSGTLERDQRMALSKAVKDLQHSFHVKDVDGMGKAIEKLARIFIDEIKL